MRQAFTIVLAVASVFIIGLICLLVCPFQALILNRWPHRGHFIPFGQFCRRVWGELMLRSHRVKVEIYGPGAHLLPDPKGMIIVSNHQSALDILIHLAYFHRGVAILAKKELLRVPLFGWCAWLAGTVYIDRSRGVKNRESLSVLEKTVQNSGSVLIYPEGTRSRNGELLAFKRGAFITAIGLQVPVLPVCVLDSWKLMPKKALSIKPGVVRMYVGEPMPTKGMSSEDRFDLADSVRNEISKHLDPAAFS